MDESFDLKILDQLIRSGQAASVRVKLSKIKKGDIDRVQIVEYADLARRVQMPELIIRWLRPIVRPEQPVHPVANVIEKATYALGLARLGVFQEALLILKDLPTKDFPQVLYYLGLVLIEQWDYGTAEVHLKKYITSTKITDYQRCVGLLNLAACYVTERHWRKADQVMNELIIQTTADDRKLLRANTYELLAQSQIFRQHSKTALDNLEKAQSILGPGNNQYAFFVRKWQTIAKFIDDPQSHLQPLQNIRDEAIETKAWETVRECDFFKSTILQDEDSFLNVYFGSNFPAYKKRILKNYGWEKPLPLKKDIPLLKYQKAGPIQRLHTDSIKLTILEKKLLHLLLADSYRPFSLPQVFGFLYPDEYFNLDSSIGKVERLAQRLRIALAKQNVPLVIKIEMGRMHLQSHYPVLIRVNRKKSKDTSNLRQKLSKVMDTIGESRFTAKSFYSVLSMSDRSGSRILAQAIHQGIVQPNLGKYKFKKVG